MPYVEEVRIHELQLKANNDHKAPATEVVVHHKFRL